MKYTDTDTNQSITMNATTKKPFCIDRCIRKYTQSEKMGAKIKTLLHRISSDEAIQRFAFFEIMARHDSSDESTASTSRQHRDHVMDAIRRRQYLFSHDAFEEIRLCIKEQEDFLNNPIQVEDGVIDCKKCGSSKTFSYAKQTRASDEGTTVFVTCAQCRHQFRL